MITWRDFRIPDQLLQCDESGLCEGEIIVQTLPGRVSLLEAFANAEERDRAELSGMLLEWAIQQLIVAGSWPELMKRTPLDRNPGRTKVTAIRPKRDEMSAKLG